MKHTPVLRCSVLGCSVLCMVLWCSGLTSASSQGRLAVWVRAVDQHQPAALDEHAKAVAGWTAADLNEVLGHALRADVSSLQTRLKRAAWLHADVAIMHRTSTGYRAASTGVQSDVFGDGRTAGVLAGTPHWAFARRLLDESGRLDEDVRAWYRATSAFLQSWNEYVELVPHLTHGLTAFPGDPFLLLVQASMQEYFAEPQIQGVIARQRRFGRTVASIGTAGAERQRALRTMRTVLDVDPSMVEARIRGANILSRLGRHREVIDEVLPLLKAPPRGTLGYWLHLIHGRTLLALDQPEGARSAFAAAAALYPDAQTPRLGLAQVAMRLGEVVNPDTLALRGDHMDDPWLTYHQNHVPHADELVVGMRQRWPR